MAIFPPLTIGRDALLAHQRALEVTGHNIANVDTPGFTRQRPVFSAVTPGAGGIGRGVSVGGVEQALDQFLEARRLASASTLAAATTGRDLVGQLEALFPVQDPGIGDALAAVLRGRERARGRPEDLTVRDQLLGAADTLASRLRAAHGGIATLQRESDGRIAQAAREGNGAAAIDRRSQPRDRREPRLGGGPANDLRDSRREALNQLAGDPPRQRRRGRERRRERLRRLRLALVLGTDAARLTTGPHATSGLDGAALSAVHVTVGDGASVALTGDARRHARRAARAP